MSKNKIISIALVLTIIALFYWYEWRPSQVRIQCAKKVELYSKTDRIDGDEYSALYKYCLNSSGVKY
jgi:hypothetical protein